MNRNQLCEGSGEEHSIKKRQAKTVEDEKRPVGSGCHELGEGWRHLHTCCLLLYSVLLLLTTPLLPVPIPCPSLQDFSPSASQSAPSKLTDLWESRILCFFESLALGKEPVLFPSCVENIELP